MSEPTSSARSSGRRSRTVLLTGGSGVVGRALLHRLRDADVVCLVHRSPVAVSRGMTVAGDITQPRLGLSPSVFQRLARQVDAVLHCAAVTDFNRTDGSLEETNVLGTQRVVEFAAAADAVLYHVSTAFVNTAATADRGRTAAGYAASKLAGEEVVRSGSVPSVILRPSVVIGDSRTGEIAAFQGLHHVVRGIFAGICPMIPFDPAWPIDFVPADLVADAIACLLEQGVCDGDYWITAGEESLHLDEAVRICVDVAREFGIEVDAPRFVPPEMFDRLIRPVFLESLPARIRISVLRMLEFFTTYLQSGDTKPSSLHRLRALGVAALPDQRTSLSTTLAYWAEANGYTRANADEVA